MSGTLNPFISGVNWCVIPTNAASAPKYPKIVSLNNPGWYSTTQRGLVMIREALLNTAEAARNTWISRAESGSKHKQQQLTCRALKRLVLNVLQTRETNHHQKPVSSVNTKYKTQLRQYRFLMFHHSCRYKTKLSICVTANGNCDRNDTIMEKLELHDSCINPQTSQVTVYIHVCPQTHISELVLSVD